MQSRKANLAALHVSSYWFSGGGAEEPLARNAREMAGWAQSPYVDHPPARAEGASWRILSRLAARTPPAGSSATTARRSLPTAAIGMSGWRSAIGNGGDTRIRTARNVRPKNKGH